MAWTQVILKNPLHEGAKQAPAGFSWTTLFFGIFLHYLEEIGSGL